MAAAAATVTVAAAATVTVAVTADADAGVHGLGFAEFFQRLVLEQRRKERKLGDKSRLAPRCPLSSNGITTKVCASVNFAATLEYI